MNLFKHIPKPSRNTSGIIRRTIIGRSHIKSSYSTAAEATDYSERTETDHHVSILDLFSIGTSYTVGPTRASKLFINHLKQHDILEKVHTLRVDMFGSLAKNTREAILMGAETECVRIKDIYKNHALNLDGKHLIHFNPDKHLVFHYFKPNHPHGLRFCAFDSEANLIATNEFFSVADEPARVPTLPFKNLSELIRVCKRKNKTIAQVVYENELRYSTAKEIREKLLCIWNTMDDSIRNGIMANPQDILPGSFHRRSAPLRYNKLIKDLYGPVIPKNTYLDSRIPLTQQDRKQASFLTKRQKSFFLHQHLDYLSVYTLAVNEENACGGRIVVTPTRSTTGTMPSVLKYYIEFISENPESDAMEFLLTASAIGSLSHVTAYDGCSMAAAGFTAVMGGTVDQIENAAKIGMGLKCDPVSFRAPYIEYENQTAIKSIAISHLALNGRDGISIDKVVENMRSNGLLIKSNASF